MKTTERLHAVRATVLGACVAAVVASSASAVADDRKPAPASASVDPELRKRIDAAIDRGSRWLLSQQSEAGTWGDFPDGPYFFHAGPTALTCYALLHAGVPRGDARIQKAFDFLLAQPLRLTYEVSLIVLAVEAKATATSDLLSKKYAKEERQLLAPESEWLKKATEWLLARRIGDYWSYPGGNGDHSNAQLAILALKSASRCGIRVPKDIWLELAQHFVKWQEPKGPATTLVLDRGVDGKGYSSVSKKPAQARGWTYDKPCPMGEAYGSMTCVGVASLVLCRSELSGSSRFAGKLATDVDDGIRDGLAWLQSNWSIEENPKRKLDYHYYFLYGLERTGILADVVKIGDHDWFREGAEFLLAHQEPDGRWKNEYGIGSDLVNTCFALLFLERSTVPVTVTTTPRVDGK
ncbi:MAG: hypothetical protein HYR85_26615 [Planctomycetes bacterium]|nr:hypothetical protein [Planctomycetota bacterium]MBI3847912.1 hypothetical protein [Planctomycetota bacterium]